MGGRMAPPGRGGGGADSIWICVLVGLAALLLHATCGDRLEGQRHVVWLLLLLLLLVVVLVVLLLLLLLAVISVGSADGAWSPRRVRGRAAHGLIVCWRG